MRWTDLPADRGSVDAGASVLARGEWDDLRRRLEQLPPGHPSRLDGEGRVDQAADGEGWVDQATDGEGRVDQAAAGEGRVDQATGGHGGDADGRRGGPDPDPERGPQGNHGDSRERHAGDTGPARPGGPGDLAGLGRREPYRPWFTAGESPEPWFAADPG
jgi:hypothetical protein